MARSLLDRACRESERLGLELWAVGGTVRDAVTGRPIVDVDAAVDRDAGPLARAIASIGGASVSFEERFGTASVELGGERLDLATLRSERYEAPGALPSVTFGASIERDLERRDFNVNAVALGLTGARRDRVVDPFGGLADLDRRRFAVLYDRSFEDDATRIWRAARLSAQRDLGPTKATLEQLVASARWLETISGDRLWAEFELIAERGRAGRTLRLLDEWGALKAVSPALAPTPQARAALRHRWRPMAGAQLAAVLLGGQAAEPARRALRRLNAPLAAARAVEDTHALLASDDAEPSRLERLAPTTAEARRAARWLDPRQTELQQALRRWERTRAHLAAVDLLALGVPEGPEVGRLLRCLHRRRYLGTLGTTAEARALVRQHLDRREDAG